MYSSADAQSVASATERGERMAADGDATEHAGATERGETMATDGDATEHAVMHPGDPASALPPLHPSPSSICLISSL